MNVIDDALRKHLMKRDVEKIYEQAKARSAEIKKKIAEESKTNNAKLPKDGKPF